MIEDLSVHSSKQQLSAATCHAAFARSSASRSATSGSADLSTVTPAGCGTSGKDCGTAGLSIVRSDG